jgi:c-di-GMP-binding flagellar brake protein YcgR
MVDLIFFNFLSNKDKNNKTENKFFVPITNKTFIVELLEQILKSRKSITIFVGNSKKVFKSFLSKVESNDNNSFLVTEYISFLNLYKSRFESEKIIFIFNYNNIYYGFDTKFINFINKNQLKVNIPNLIYKLQRREFVRVKQSVTMPVKIKIAPYYKNDLRDDFIQFIEFWTKEKNSISPTVVDISEGGVSIIIYSTTESLDSYNFPIFRMILKIFDKDISVISRIASILPLANKDKKYRYRIGFSFRNISNADRSIIKEYIMERQSEILKNRKRNL